MKNIHSAQMANVLLEQAYVRDTNGCFSFSAAAFNVAVAKEDLRCEHDV